MKKYYYIFSEGSSINQLICAILINLSVFAYGTAIGWMSPMGLLLQSPESPRGYPLTTTELSMMASSAYLVCVAGDFIMAYVGDKLGRKNALLITSGCCAICWAIKLCSMETWAFVLARCFVGMTMAGAYVTCSLYTKEISQDSIRGFLGSLLMLSHTTGNLFIYVVGDLLSYYTVLWVCLAIPIVQMTVFMMMPESPSYLVKNGRHDEALRVLAWLRCRREDDSTVQQELEVLKKEQQKDEGSSKFVFKAIFEDKLIYRAFKVAMVIVIARESCGVNAVLNFAGEIFENASKGTSGGGLMITPNQQAMMLGLIQVAGSALASSAVETAGRKPLLFLSSLVSGLSMMALATWFLLRDQGIVIPGWIPITSLCTCLFCDAAGLLPVSILVTGEMFSFKFRGSVMALGMATASVTDFLQLLFFKPLAAAIGIHVAFYFFGLVCLFIAFYTIVYVPETKGKSLAEIMYSLKTRREKEEDERELKIGDIKVQ